MPQFRLKFINDFEYIFFVDHLDNSSIKDKYSSIVFIN